MLVHCKKAFKGNIDIRNYIVEKAIKNNESITVKCDAFEEVSIYSPEELKNPLRNQGPYQSKFEGKYYLYVYKWKI